MHYLTISQLAVALGLPLRVTATLAEDETCRCRLAGARNRSSYFVMRRIGASRPLHRGQRALIWRHISRRLR